MKKSEILQKALIRVLEELLSLKVIIGDNKFEHLMYKFKTFEEYMKGEIVFERGLEKDRETE